MPRESGRRNIRYHEIGMYRLEPIGTYSPAALDITLATRPGATSLCSKFAPFRSLGPLRSFGSLRSSLFYGGTVTGDPFDANAKVKERDWAFYTPDNRLNVTRLPPQLMLLKQRPGELAPVARLRGIGQFLIPARNDDALPLLRTMNFVRFEGHQWVFTHPLDLLAGGRRTVQTVLEVGEEERNNIGLVRPRAGKPPETDAGQEPHTLLSRQFPDEHGQLPKMAALLRNATLNL